MTHDINLTSQEWLDIIFEGKNKDYGAYTLRSDSPKRHSVAFIVVAAAAVLTILSASLINTYNQNKRKEKITDVVQMSDISMKNAEVPKENIEKRYEAPPPIELKSTIKFTAPVIMDDNKVNENNQITSQDELVGAKVEISTTTVIGTDEQFGKNIADLEKDKLVVGEKAPDEEVHIVVEQPPSFPGGDAALMEYLNNNISYPAIAVDMNIQGKVTCSFVVGKDGSIQDVRVERSVDGSLDKEAVRVIKSMPRWIPGRQGGNAVKVKYYLPVTFRLQ